MRCNCLICLQRRESAGCVCRRLIGRSSKSCQIFGIHCDAVSTRTNCLTAATLMLLAPAVSANIAAVGMIKILMIPMNNSTDGSCPQGLPTRVSRSAAINAADPDKKRDLQPQNTVVLCVIWRLRQVHPATDIGACGNETVMHFGHQCIFAAGFLENFL